MRRTMAMAVLLLFAAGCGGGIPPLGLDAPTGARYVKEQSKPADLRDVVAGGPLAVLSPDTGQPTLRAFRKLRQARVDELVRMMGDEREELAEVLEKMPAYRAALVTFFGKFLEGLNAADAGQAMLKLRAENAIDRVLRTIVRTTEAQAYLDSLVRTIEGMSAAEKEKSGPLLPMFQYLEYAALQKLSNAIAVELTNSPARTGALIVVVQEDEKRFDKKLRKLAKKSDRKIGKLLADIDEDLRGALATQFDLRAGFDSLAAADYAFTMATVDFAALAVPEIKLRIGEIKIGEATTEEDKAFYESYAAFLGAWTDVMRAGIEATPPPPFLRTLKVSSHEIPIFEGVAHAGVRDWLDKASSALTAGIKGTGVALYTVASTAATATVAVGDAVTEATGAKAAFRGAQKLVGAGVSMVDLVVGAGMDIAANRYYGNSRKDEVSQVAETITRTFKAWDEGKPGKDTLREGVNILTAAEETVGAATAAVVAGSFGLAEAAVSTATGGAIDTIPGRETVTWATSGLAQMTAGMATGFGKGVMALSNPDSSNEELFDGAVDVAFSFVGGTKAVVKGSQAVKGVKELSKELAEKGANQLKRLELKLENAALKGTTDDIMREAGESLSAREIQIIADNERKIAQNLLEKQLLERQEKSIVKILDDLVEKADRKILGNLDDAGQGARNFMNQGFENSAKGMKEAAGEIAGKTLPDYFDNIVGGMADNALKGMVKEGFKWLAGPEEQKEIAQSESLGKKIAALDPADPAAKEAIEKIQKIQEKTQKELAAAPEAAEQVAAVKTEAAVKEKLLEEVDKKADKAIEKALATPVRATGTFSGSYSGALTITLTPGGGPVSGTVTTQYGTATVSGNVSKEGVLTAHVSGPMQYDYYPDGVHAEKRSCSLSASMNGSVRAKSASGTYSGSCAKENDRGGWSARW